MDKTPDHEVPNEIKPLLRYVCDGKPPATALGELTDQIPENEWKECFRVTAGTQTWRTRLAWREIFLQHDLRRARGEMEKA